MKIVKPTLLAVIVLEIISLFFLLHVYDKFVSNPQNYTSTSVVSRQAKKRGADMDLNKLIDTSAPSKAPPNQKK